MALVASEDSSRVKSGGGRGGRGPGGRGTGGRGGGRGLPKKGTESTAEVAQEES